MKSQLEARAARMTRSELIEALRIAHNTKRYRIAEVLDEERHARVQDHFDREHACLDPQWEGGVQ